LVAQAQDVQTQLLQLFFNKIVCYKEKIYLKKLFYLQFFPSPSRDPPTLESVSREWAYRCEKKRPSLQPHA
jgi:hypothetical protein